MRPNVFVSASIALLLSVTALACASTADDSDSDTATDDSEDALTGRQLLQGSWSDDQVGIDLRPNGHFIRDTPGITGSALKREGGTFAVSMKNKTLTLHVTGASSSEIYDYTYAKGAHGASVPGASSPGASLALTRRAPPRSRIAFQTQHFIHMDSWCTSNADCTMERADKTWPGIAFTGSTATCNQSTNSCLDNGPPGGGGGGVSCGDTTCGADEQCCSSSCGICQPKGTMCPHIACATP